MLTQRTEMQLSCLFISKHTGLEKFCFKEKKTTNQTKSDAVRGECKGRKARESYTHGRSSKAAPLQPKFKGCSFGDLVRQCYNQA